MIRSMAGFRIAPLAGILVLTMAACRPGSETTNPTPSASSSTPSSATTSAPSAADPSPSAQGAPAAGDPKWYASAARAPGELASGIGRLRASKARPRNMDAIDAVLDEVASQPATAAGIRSAASILHAAPDKLQDPKWAGSGTAPWAQWLHHGGIAILGDLAQRACASGDRPATAKAIDEIDLPPIFNSGGVDRNAMTEQRERLQKASAACRSKGSLPF